MYIVCGFASQFVFSYWSVMFFKSVCSIPTTFILTDKMLYSTCFKVFELGTGARAVADGETKARSVGTTGHYITGSMPEGGRTAFSAFRRIFCTHPAWN